MTDRNIELSRRKILGAAGAIGIAGAGAGMGTSALFSDEESFENNSITAGTLDMTVDAEIVAVNTEYDNAVGPINYNVTADGAAATGLTLEDFKPGDWVIVCYEITIEDNPGYVQVQANNLVSDENGFEEPEPEDGASDGEGELDDKLLTTVWDDYDDSGNRSGLSTLDIVTNNAASSFPDSASTNHSWDSSRSEGGEFNSDIHYTTLQETYNDWFEDGFLLGPGPGSDASKIGGPANDQESKVVYLLLEIPVEVGNKIQGDSVSFDLEWRAEQIRNNDDPFSGRLVLDGSSQQGQGAGFANAWDTTSSLAHAGTGAWGTIDRSGQSISSYKQGFYFGGFFSNNDVLPEFTVSEIEEISYWLYEDSPLSGVDIYLNIYTQPENDGDDSGFYDSRLQALPSEANGGNPNFTPGSWNEFSTAASAPNTLTWGDTGRGGSFNQTLPDLNDIQSGSIDWSTYGGGLTQTHDYRDEKILALSLQTASQSGVGLEAYIDDVSVQLTGGQELVLDLEP